MVAKHRRYEIEPSFASGGAPATAEYWPEAVGYDAAPVARPTILDSGAGAPPYGYPASYGYDGPAAEPGWTAALGAYSWQDFEEWRDWGPPPALHPDHPSAPVPRIQLPADHPSAPLPAIGALDVPDLPQRRPDRSARGRGTPRPLPDTGYGNGSRRLYAVPDGPQVGGRWQESTREYHHENGARVRGPATGSFPNGRFPVGPFPDRESLQMAGRVLTLADGRAAQIAQEAQDYAAAIRDAAERDAAAITQQATDRADAITRQATDEAAAVREAAEREVTEQRASLDSMWDELGRVAAYVTEHLAAPALPATAAAPPVIGQALPATAPAPPGVSPRVPRTRPVLPDTRPARPEARPARPETSPDASPARPARSVRPAATPAGKPQKRSRQQQAIRVAAGATAALLSIAAISGATEIGVHGFKFFVFRAGGVGQTPGNETDQQFLARQAAAAHHVAAAKGRHVKKSDQALEVHH